jgi:hypothetical protein
MAKKYIFNPKLPKSGRRGKSREGSFRKISARSKESYDWFGKERRRNKLN